MLLFSKVVALVGLVLGSWEDLRTREVPDWLNFGLMFAGVGGALIFSITRDDYNLLISSVIGLLVCVALAYLMYYTAQWGGGDAKLLMGMGALIGLDVMNLDQLPTLVLLLVNIFIVGALYGLLWSAYLAVKKWSRFKEEWKNRLYSDKMTFFRKLNLVLALVLLVAIYFVPLQLKVLLFGLLLFLYASIYLWVFVKSVEDACMIKEVKVEELVEGDWIVEEIEVGGERVTGPDDLGITSEKIDMLKSADIEAVMVREGVPFVPSFLLGFIITITWGNWFLLLA